MVSVLDYLICIPFWVDVYYSSKSYWSDKSDVQAKYTLLMFLFMAVALTLTWPILFRAIVKLFSIKNITRLMVDFFASLSIYYYYAMLIEVHPPYRRHLSFIRLHLFLVLLILSFCFFRTDTQRELLYTVDCGEDFFNFAYNIAFLSFFVWSSGIGVVHFRRQGALANDFFLKARLWFIFFTCSLALTYCVLKFSVLIIQRFSPGYFPASFFFVTVKLITIVVGILSGLILTMPKRLERLILFFYDFLIIRSLHRDLYILLSILEDLLSALRSNHQLTQKSYYISALGKKLGLEEEEIQLIKEASVIFDIKQGRMNQSSQKALNSVRRDLTAGTLAGPTISQPDFLKQLYFFHNLYQVSRHIDENYDGTGKPSGLAKDNIPLGARIIRVVDYYAKRKEMGIETSTVVNELQEESGKVFDPKIVAAFLEILREVNINGNVPQL